MQYQIQAAASETRKAALQTIRKLQEKYVTSSGQSSPTNFNTIPDPSQYKDKTIRDDKTGQKYRSDGSRWVTVKE